MNMKTNALQVQHVKLDYLADMDIPQLLNWINDRDLVLNNSPYRPVHEDQHKNWFDAIRHRQDAVIFGIRLCDSNELIGSCQLHNIHPVHRTAELQIRIGNAEVRGRGLGTEAIRLLLSFAFKDLNLHRVYLHVFASNTAAIRAYQRAEFRNEGLLRQHAHIDGSYVDVLIMGILREEFHAH